MPKSDPMVLGKRDTGQQPEVEVGKKYSPTKRGRLTEPAQMKEQAVVAAAERRGQVARARSHALAARGHEAAHEAAHRNEQQDRLAQLAQQNQRLQESQQKNIVQPVRTQVETQEKPALEKTGSQLILEDQKRDLKKMGALPAEKPGELDPVQTVEQSSAVNQIDDRLQQLETQLGGGENVGMGTQNIAQEHMGPEGGVEALDDPDVDEKLEEPPPAEARWNRRLRTDRACCSGAQCNKGLRRKQNQPTTPSVDPERARGKLDRDCCTVTETQRPEPKPAVVVTVPKPPKPAVVAPTEHKDQNQRLKRKPVVIPTRVETKKPVENPKKRRRSTLLARSPIF